jgi:hypothetical protein
LAGAGAGIDDGAVAILSQPRGVGYPRGNSQQMAQQRFIPLGSIVERFKVIPRNNQQVGGRLGIQVANDDRAIILVREVTGNFLRRYAAKQATLF